MKTVKPVSQETYERIGKAYAICSEYPDVFGDVTFRKFCGMFVDDIIDEGEDLIAARKKAYAGNMYRLLHAAFESLAYAGIDESLRLEIDECLSRITCDTCPTETDIEDEHLERMKAAGPEMYRILCEVYEQTQYISLGSDLEAKIDKVLRLVDRD